MPKHSVTRRQFNTTLLTGSAASLAAPAVFAQATWPNKPIRLVVPYTPGGFTDVTARLVAQKLQERLGQPVTIDNKPGACSICATSRAVTSVKPPGVYGTTKRIGLFGQLACANSAGAASVAALPASSMVLNWRRVTGCFGMVWFSWGMGFRRRPCTGRAARA